jgi:hypothetical protein
VTAAAIKARLTWQFGVQASCIAYQPSATACFPPSCRLFGARNLQWVLAAAINSLTEVCYCREQKRERSSPMLERRRSRSQNAAAEIGRRHSDRAAKRGRERARLGEAEHQTHLRHRAGAFLQ